MSPNVNARQIDLWGNTVTPFESARERYGTWPTTVWPINHSDPTTKELKSLIGDSGIAGDPTQTRDGTFTAFADDDSVYGGKVGASVFSPQVTQWILNMFAPTTPANIFDPFAGGGTRAILSGASGYRYLGIEIRQEETEAVRQRIERAGVAGSVLVVTGDSRFQQAPPTWADFVITCPPYYDLEQYNGPEGDLSMVPNYGAFLEGIGQVIDQIAAVLKPGGLACWVMGLIRNPKGELVPLHHDIATLHIRKGFSLKEEVILHQMNNGAIQRIGNFNKGQGFLIRLHEYLHIYRRRQ